MKVYFLGTGTSQGIPVIGSHHSVCLSDDSKDKRLRVSVWIQDDDFSVIIDCGPDFRQQMLQSKCPQIDAILFTHEHADHTSGLDDIRPFFYKQGNIPVYAHKRVLLNLSNRFDYIFKDADKYPGAPSVITNEIVNGQNFQIKNTTITPVNAMHGNLQVFGFKINNFAYLTDIKTIANSEIDKFKGIDTLVINALREEEHDTHFNLKEALDFIDLVQPKKAYITHISHMLGFHEEVQQTLPNNVFLAYDNLQISI
ncbi:MBL fold metallo-hydrolase [uncultured Flavobacterium sp.]|uniref:MBL fold metallo-hydrolase n=1 Tax=uncultured Flavobacterium sp. TaxID=165435 RepID=UPI0030CA5096